MKKILITGGSGQLGYDIYRELNKRYGDDVKIFMPNHAVLDITDENSVKELIDSFKPDVVFHAAAYTKVDDAEDNKEACFKANSYATQVIAEACESIGAKLIYVSTDYVFDGKKGSPYSEGDLINPINVYGSSKAAGEKKAMLNPKTFVVRTSWVFGINGKNFVKTMLDLAEKRDKLTVVSDQIGSPTYTVDLARLLVDMSESDKYGIYHATNEGDTTWYNFAKEIFEVNHKNITVEPVTSEEYSSKAERPTDSRLSKQKLVDAGFKTLPHYRDALERFSNELEAYKEYMATCYANENVEFANKTKAISTNLKDCYVVDPHVFGDARGSFAPIFMAEYMEQLGFRKSVQDNRSISHKGVFRGLHFQKNPYSQAKIVYVDKGAAFVVVVDMRVDSPTYLKSTSLLLTPFDPSDPKSGLELFVPAGFAHGYLALKDNTWYMYKIDNDYMPSSEGGVLWCDPSLDIDWKRLFAEGCIDEDDLDLKDDDKNRPKLDGTEEYFHCKKLELNNKPTNYNFEVGM